MAMNKQQLLSAYRQAVRVANQRLIRIEKSGVDSPAYRSLSGDRFSSKGASKMNYNQLLQAFTKVNKWLNLKTSSVGKARKVQKATEKKLNLNFGSEDESKEFWKLIDLVKALYPNVWEDKRHLGSYKMLDVVKHYYDLSVKNGKNYSQKANTIISNINRIIKNNSSFIEYYDSKFKDKKVIQPKEK